MQIETKNLILRDHQASDWSDIHEYAKDPDFSRYDFWGPNTEEDTKNFVNDKIKQAEVHSRYEFDFAVVDKKTSKVIGGAGLRRQSESSSVGNLGYAINPIFQGKGLATEAVQALMKFGFKDLGLQVIWATCDVQNSASYKVMEKNQMKKVGHIIKHKEFKGRWHDSYRYEITVSEYMHVTVSKDL